MALGYSCSVAIQFSSVTFPTMSFDTPCPDLPVEGGEEHSTPEAFARSIVRYPGLSGSILPERGVSDCSAMMGHCMDPPRQDMQGYIIVHTEGAAPMHWPPHHTGSPGR